MTVRVLFFSIGAISLGLIGLWGTRRARALAHVPGYDDKSNDHRRQVIRRGSITCLVLAALFVAVAVVQILAATG